MINNTFNSPLSPANLASFASAADRREENLLNAFHKKSYSSSAFSGPGLLKSNILNKVTSFAPATKRKFSKLDPWFVTGLIDAEGSFSILINKDNRRNLGWRVQGKFQLGLHKRDLSILLELRNYLGGIGSIHIYSNRDIVNYSIDSTKNLMVLINHLEKYPLFSSKKLDYNDWKEIALLILEDKHYTEKGIERTEFVRNNMNLKRTSFTWNHLNKLS